MGHHLLPIAGTKAAVGVCLQANLGTWKPIRLQASPTATLEDAPGKKQSAGVIAAIAVTRHGGGTLLLMQVEIGRVLVLEAAQLIRLQPFAGRQ